VFKVKVVAERLQCSQATIYALIASGRLRCYRIGTGRGALRVSEEQMAEFLSGAESRHAEPAPQPTRRLPKLRHLHVD
jgi:excisionase family DNA binding protein